MAITDQPKYTAQVHQFDRNPGRGESILHALADPPPTAVEAEETVEAAHIATGDTRGLNPTQSLLAHRDAIRDAADTASRFHYDEE